MERCQKSRLVLHLDADAFFVSCELASRPDLVLRPVAVGGMKRGIIASANYVARARGVHAPMPTSRALKVCPELVVLLGNWEKYERFSGHMFDMLGRIAPVVEKCSIDEGYADLSGLRTAEPSKLARGLRAEIKSRLGISVSMGLASNKLVSAVASKFRKPDSFVEVPAGEERSFLAPLGVRWLPGVGPKMESELSSAGIIRIGDVTSASEESLIRIAGSSAPFLRACALGIDERPVALESEPAKSCSLQMTFERNTSDPEMVRRTLLGMADDLMWKVRSEGKSVKCVEVKVRYGDMSQCQRSESLADPTDIETDVYDAVGRLLRRAWSRRASLRLVGLKFSGMHGPSSQQDLGLPGYGREPRLALAKTMDALKERYGSTAIVRAHQISATRPRPKPRRSARHG